MAMKKNLATAVAAANKGKLEAQQPEKAPATDEFRASSVRLKASDWDLLEAVAKRRMREGKQSAQGRRGGSVSAVIAELIEERRGELSKESSGK
jgi:coenzyme F420-reducing hydrogenase beta subunit